MLANEQRFIRHNGGVAPYEGIDESDPVLVAQRDASLLVMNANSGEIRETLELNNHIENAAKKALELATEANLNMQSLQPASNLEN